MSYSPTARSPQKESSGACAGYRLLIETKNLQSQLIRALLGLVRQTSIINQSHRNTSYAIAPKLRMLDIALIMVDIAQAQEHIHPYIFPSTLTHERLLLLTLPLPPPFHPPNPPLNPHHPPLPFHPTLSPSQHTNLIPPLQHSGTPQPQLT